MRTTTWSMGMPDAHVGVARCTTHTVGAARATVTPMTPSRLILRMGIPLDDVRLAQFSPERRRLLPGSRAVEVKAFRRDDASSPVARSDGLRARRALDQGTLACPAKPLA